MNYQGLIDSGYSIIKKPNDKHIFVKIYCNTCNKEMIVRSDYIEKKLPICTSCQKKNNKNNLKHGDYRKRLYKIWRGMLRRKYNTYTPSVCEEWKNSYESFREWALSHGYTDELTIDRINNKGDYEPSNCRWITLAENARRARQIFSKEEKIKYFYLRKELGLTQREMATKLGVSRNTIQRLEKEVKKNGVI